MWLRSICLGFLALFVGLEAIASPTVRIDYSEGVNVSCASPTGCSDTFKLPCQISRIQNLPSFLSESSALCETAEGIWSINDSDNPPALYLLRRKAYELWRDSGRVLLDAHFIRFDISVKNNDWEALETDGTYLYLGDFGNNLGNRRNLRIVKIPIQALLHTLSLNTRTTNDSMVVDCAALLWEEIRFSYADQTNFDARRLHNFDCEAMIVEEQRILLLSKNWKNLRCDIYALPKDSGVYVTSRIGHFNPGFLVTDATSRGNTWYVCGYGPSGNQYIGSINRLKFNGFTRTKLPLKPAQIEGIHCDMRTNQFILSTEARKTQVQAILLLDGL
jgi:hypothetical protein